MKQTVAIIGAATPTGNRVAKALAADSLLLLIDSNEQAVIDLATAVRSQHGGAAEPITCCKEASWEADAIVVTVAEAAVPAIAEKIKAVTTCKPVVHFAGSEGASLLPLLPHAKVVTVWLSSRAGSTQLSAFVQGSDAEATALAAKILSALGCGADAVAAR